VLWLAIPFVLCIALLYPVNQYHDRVAMELQHATAYPAVGSLTPSQVFRVRIKAPSDALRIVNINGHGTVSVYLSPTEDPRDAVQSLEDWDLEWRVDEYLYADFPLDGVAPGDYYLHFVMAEGWGYFEFTLAHGGGTASHLSALVYGVLMAGAVGKIFLSQLEEDGVRRAIAQNGLPSYTPQSIVDIDDYLAELDRADRAYLIVAAQVDRFLTSHPDVSGTVVGGWQGKLSNKGETIRLMDAQNNLVDSVSYYDEGDWGKVERPAALPFREILRLLRRFRLQKRRDHLLQGR